MTRHVLALLAATALVGVTTQATHTVEGYKTTYQVLTEGTGDKVVKKSSKVKVHATGKVHETGKKFWSTKDKGQQPFEYTGIRPCGLEPCTAERAPHLLLFEE